MEALQVAQHIERIILALVKEGKRSTELINSKAEAAKAYDEEIGLCSAAHKASGVAIGMISSQAKKDAAQKLYDKIIAEETLKAHYSRIELLKAQLNGYQSIYKHLEVT